MNDPASLFERLLGASFNGLPAPVRRLHDRRIQKIFVGRCRVERGRSRLAAWLARAASLPAAGDDCPVQVSLISNDRSETWSRDFGGRTMRSTLTECQGRLQESLGPVELAFELRADDRSIEWNVTGAKVFGLSLPAAWFKRVTARESVEAGRYTFDVRAELPGVGLLIHYRGWLDVDRD